MKRVIRIEKVAVTKFRDKTFEAVAAIRVEGRVNAYDIFNYPMRINGEEIGKVIATSEEGDDSSVLVAQLKDERITERLKRLAKEVMVHVFDTVLVGARPERVFIDGMAVKMVDVDVSVPVDTTVSKDGRWQERRPVGRELP